MASFHWWGLGETRIGVLLTRQQNVVTPICKKKARHMASFFLANCIVNVLTGGMEVADCFTLLFLHICMASGLTCPLSPTIAIPHK